MNSARETLARVAAALDSADVRYMVVGSFASTLHGEPRTTQDIDIVIEADPGKLDRFVKALPTSNWYVDADAAREALHLRSLFNVIDTKSGWKIDIICLRAGAFPAMEFSRRLPAEILGTHVFVATAEDTLLAKLGWASESGSDRQLRDAAGIVAALGDDLDRDYVDHWAGELGVTDLWSDVLASADSND